MTHRESSSRSAPELPRSGWKSKYSSEQGPQGPVGPEAQKLSAAPILWIRSTGTPTCKRRAEGSDCYCNMHANVIVTCDVERSVLCPLFRPT